jgi:leader peptidase (prepilin peptidase)/N-methyltransferase
LGVSLASAALVDVHEQRLPNSLLAIGAVAGVVAAVADRVLGGAFVGLAVAGGLMLLVRLTRGVGMGDVKMAGVVGLATAEAGLVAAPIAVAIAALTAGVVGAVAGRTRLPLGPSLWLGWALALVLPIGRWWS